MIAGGTVVVQPLLSSSPPVEAAGLITFDVLTSRDSLDPGGPTAGAEVADWKYRIDRDNTGDPYGDAALCEADGNGDFPAGFPAGCEWPSIKSFHPGNQPLGGPSPIVTQGDFSDFETGGPFAGGIPLEAGKYLISVTAPGHKIGGANFTVGGVDQNITVLLDPYPLPLVTLRARVFNDETTNGQIDVPAEAVEDDPTAPGYTARGMSGFTATINDWADEVTTDWYGNPLCTDYEPADPVGPRGEILEVVTDLDANGDPTPIEGTGGKCVSNFYGDIIIPNLGPNRYAMTIAPPPDDPAWTQTTTLEGGLDWDIWAMEGYTGFDTEFNVGGESVPWVTFGYVRDRSGATTNVPEYYSAGPAGTNTIKGIAARYDAYTPGVGQQPNTGTVWGGFSGAKITGPIEEPYVALLDLQDGDRAVWVGQGDADGKFEINGVRDGEYQLTIWERDLLTILDFFQVTVENGEVLDTGVLGLTGWFTNYYGHVFLDYNENGRMDPGEPGVPDFGLALLRRENAPVENGQNAATTDGSGYYEFENAYPYTMWTVMEAYNDRYHTTGVTYQVSNQPAQTTTRGGGVDIHVLPIIGQSARIDWGVVPYKKGENGSIAGTVFYDVTINELDARIAAVEDWSSGVPGITLNVYHAVQQLDGSWTKGAMADDPVVSETWEQPAGCIPRDGEGKPIPDQLLFPAGGDVCVEAPLTGIQVDPLAGDELGVAVNGNFGFGDLDPGKYIVELDIPVDDFGRPLYRVEDEESVNVFAGDVYTPTNITGGPPSAGPDVNDPGLLDGQMDTDPDRLPVSDPATQAPGAAAICVGAPRLVDITGEFGTADVDPSGVNEINPLFADAGGTPYQGVEMPGCEAKLIEVLEGRSVAPGFTLYNEVPPPAHFWGYTIDDLNIDTNPRRTSFGEKRALSYAPTGVYNWAGRLITQVNADVNGLWEVLLPSSTTMNCPSPAGVCPGMYRFVGNDPGPPSRPFRDYNPNYRTIAANFQAWPGVNTVADTAPTQVGASILAPGGQFNALAVCASEDTRPQVFKVNRPYARVTGGSQLRDLVITGNFFGAAEGTLRLVDLDTDAVVYTIPASAVTWGDDEITATIPTTIPNNVRGAFQLEIVRTDGVRPVNSITFHVIGTGGGGGSVNYNPQLREVGPGQSYTTIQDGIDAVTGNNVGLVVVYPNVGPGLDGAYYENVIISRPVMVQGVGAGGVYENGTGVVGTIVHGGNFWASSYNPTDPFTNVEFNATAWYDRLADLAWDGNQAVADGSVFYVVAEEGDFTANDVARLDGMKITGGDQRDFPGDLESIIGTVPATLANNATTQGGGVFLNAYARATSASRTTCSPRTAAPTAVPSGSAPRSSATTRTRTSRSPATGSSPTAARSWRVASRSSTAPMTTRSPTTRSAATRRPSTAAASATSVTAPVDTSTTTGSCSTRRTTRAAESTSPASCLPTQRCSPRAPVPCGSAATSSRPTCPTTTAAACGSSRRATTRSSSTTTSSPTTWPPTRAAAWRSTMPPTSGS